MNAVINNSSSKRFLAIITVATILLFIPFIAMQFTSEVKWTAYDFIIAAVLLYGTGTICELVLRTVRKTTHRMVICGITLFILCIIWLELAVGIFGSPFAGS